MATIEDAYYAVAQGAGSAEDKIKIMKEIRSAILSDRWATRGVIWGLLLVVILPIIGLTISFTW